MLEQCVGHINLPGLRGGVKNGRVLASGAEAIICDFWNPGVQTFDSPDDIFFNFGSPTAVTFPLPDSRDTVVRFEMSSPEERQAMLEKHAADFAAATKRRPF